MTSQPSSRRLLRHVLHVAMTFVLFSLCNVASRFFEVEPGVSILFPATAVTVVSAMWFGWPAMIGVVLGTVATPWDSNASLPLLLVSGCICATEGLIPWAVFRLRRDLTLDLRDMRSLVYFIVFGTVLNMAVSATLGALFIIPHGEGTAFNLKAAVFWWVGGFTASLLVAMPLIAFGGQFFNRSAAADRPRTLTNALQIVTLILLLGFATSFLVRTSLLNRLEYDRLQTQQRIAESQHLLNALHDNFLAAAYSSASDRAAASAMNRNDVLVRQLVPLMEVEPVAVRTEFTRTAAETVSWFEQRRATGFTPLLALRAQALGTRILKLRATIDKLNVTRLGTAEHARERIILVTTVLDAAVFAILLFASATLLVNISRPLGQLRDAIGSLREGSTVQTSRIQAPYQELRNVASALSEASRTLREREEELKKQTEAAVQASRHKTDFLAKMSHELRTPLNSIIGFTELLIEQEETIKPEKRLSFLGNVEGSARHLLKLINDLLDIARIESGKFDLNIEQFDIRHAIESTVSSTSALFLRKKQEIDVEMPDDPLMIYGDAGRIEQVLLNLLSNANKFSPAGERITVRGSGDDLSCRIEVIDRGIGVSEADRRRIFDEFEQVQTKGGEHSTGTGLGLALAQKFVEAHGGTISLTSAPGEGATFIVTLPRMPLLPQ